LIFIEESYDFASDDKVVEESAEAYFKLQIEQAVQDSPSDESTLRTEWAKIKS